MVLPRSTTGFALAALLAGGLRAETPNVLLVIADDIGVDRVAAYGAHPTPGRTPTIDALAERGVLFTRVWAQPFCSPTRATLLTGRYPVRTGLGTFVDARRSKAGILDDEWTLPQALATREVEPAYRTACIGKWHLSGREQPLTHPNDRGFERFAGSIGNLGPSDKPRSYWTWTRVADGVELAAKAYATTVAVDDTLSAIEEFGDDPWFVWLAFQAGHVPFHAPPDELHGFELEGEPEDSPIPHHKAMVEAMDTELGRLLAGIDPKVLARTTIIVVGDNGTPTPAVEPPFAPRGKGTMFEGALRVPLVVAGFGVADTARGTRCEALVDTVDLFPTICALAGVAEDELASRELDGVSLVDYFAHPEAPSRRAFCFAEKFSPNHAESYDMHFRAVRDERFKLIENVGGGKERFYDLELDPEERRNRLGEKARELSEEEQDRLDALRARFAQLDRERRR